MSLSQLFSKPLKSIGKNLNDTDSYSICSNVLETNVILKKNRKYEEKNIIKEMYSNKNHKSFKRKNDSDLKLIENDIYFGRDQPIDVQEINCPQELHIRTWESFQKNMTNKKTIDKQTSHVLNAGPTQGSIFLNSEVTTHENGLSSKEALVSPNSEEIVTFKNKRTLHSYEDSYFGTNNLNRKKKKGKHNKKKPNNKTDQSSHFNTKDPLKKQFFSKTKIIDKSLKKQKKRKKHRLKVTRLESKESSTPCKFYINGCCNKGSSCKFNHQVQQQRKAEVCKHYVIDVCTKGEDCLYYHQDWPCKYFHLKGFCNNKDTCKFSHQPLDRIAEELLKKIQKEDKDAQSKRMSTPLSAHSEKFKDWHLHGFWKEPLPVYVNHRVAFRLIPIEVEKKVVYRENKNLDIVSNFYNYNKTSSEKNDLDFNNKQITPENEKISIMARKELSASLVRQQIIEDPRLRKKKPFTQENN